MTNQFNDRETEIMCVALHLDGKVIDLSGRGFLQSEVDELAEKLRHLVRDMIMRRNAWADRLVEELKAEQAE